MSLETAFIDAIKNNNTKEALELLKANDEKNSVKKLVFNPVGDNDHDIFDLSKKALKAFFDTINKSNVTELAFVEIELQYLEIEESGQELLDIFFAELKELSKLKIFSLTGDISDLSAKNLKKFLTSLPKSIDTLKLNFLDIALLSMSWKNIWDILLKGTHIKKIDLSNSTLEENKQKKFTNFCKVLFSFEKVAFNNCDIFFLGKDDEDGSEDEDALLAEAKQLAKKFVIFLSCLEESTKIRDFSFINENSFFYEETLNDFLNALPKNLNTLGLSLKDLNKISVKIPDTVKTLFIQWNDLNQMIKKKLKTKKFITLLSNSKIDTLCITERITGNFDTPEDKKKNDVSLGDFKNIIDFLKKINRDLSTKIFFNFDLPNLHRKQYRSTLLNLNKNKHCLYPEKFKEFLPVTSTTEYTTNKKTYFTDVDFFFSDDSKKRKRSISFDENFYEEKIVKNSSLYKPQTPR